MVQGFYYRQLVHGPEPVKAAQFNGRFFVQLKGVGKIGVERRERNVKGLVIVNTLVAVVVNVGEEICIPPLACNCLRTRKLLLNN